MRRMMTGWFLAAAMLAPGLARADEFQDLAKREFGSGTDAIDGIVKQIQEAKPEQYPAIEAKLIAVVESPNATFAGKQFACQALQAVGSEKCVPALSKLLLDERLSHSARYALQKMDSPAVDRALQEALAKTKGNTKIGILNTLGDRAKPATIGSLAALAGDSDPAVAGAAIRAIGRIAGPESVDALSRIKPREETREVWAAAYLQCADRLAAANDPRAGGMYRSVFDGKNSGAVRAGAFGGLVKTQPNAAASLILDALKSDDRTLRRAAVSAVANTTAEAVNEAFAKGLPGLPAESKAALLQGLAGRGGAAGLLPVIHQLTADEDETVRLAAIESLAKLGDASSVKAMAPLVVGTGPQRNAAMRSLIAIQAPDAIDAILQLADTCDPSVRVGMFGVLADRQVAKALPVVRKAVADADAKVRRAALKAIGSLGVCEDVPRLVQALVATKDDGEQDSMARAISLIAGRQTEKNERCLPIIAGIGKADEGAKIKLLGTLAGLGDPAALAELRKHLAAEGEVKKAAVRAVAEWPDATPINDMLALAKNDSSASVKVLALRGYVRMIGLTKNAKQKLAAYSQAMELASRPDEKKLVLAGLGDVATVEALAKVEGYLTDPALKNEAFVAYERIGELLAGKNADAARAALNRVVESSGNKGLAEKAKKAIGKIK